MKILIAADIFPPESGGPATYVVQFANEMKKRGHEIQIISLNPFSDESKVDCPLFKVRESSKIGKYFQYISLLFKHAKETEIIYAMGPVNAGLPAFLVSALRNKKLAVKVVGDYAWEQGIQRFGVKELVDEFQTKKYGTQVEVLRWVQRLVVQKAQVVITPSIYLKNMVVGWGAENVSVVTNAVSFQKAESIAKPSNERWIVSVGRLVPWKGFSVLIEVIKELKSEFPQLRLKIIGEGPEKDKLKAQMQNESSYMELLGNLSRENTFGAIASSDIFILNSAYEGMSHVLLEALYLKRNILASKSGGNSEVIQHEKNGLLFEYNNKEEIKEKMRMVLKGEWKAEFSENITHTYSIQKMIESTQELLQTLCS